MTQAIRWLHSVGMGDVDEVGGKNASIGEMLSQLGGTGVATPGGFATTAAAYRSFLAFNGLDERIGGLLAKIDTEDVVALASAGREIRNLMEAGALPAGLERDIREAHAAMTEGVAGELAVAVRSSATADVPLQSRR